MTVMRVDINKYLAYELYFANFGNSYEDDEVVILEVVDKITEEVIANVMKSVLEKVSDTEYQREAQLRNEFDLMVNKLTDYDWNNIKQYDDDEWVLLHRITYALENTIFEDNAPF